MGLQLGGRRRVPISGISRQWEQSTSPFYQKKKKASLPARFFSAAVRLSCGMECVSHWMKHCYGLHDVHAPGMFTSMWEMDGNKYFHLMHTPKHSHCNCIWRILSVPVSREHFPLRAASAVVLLFLYALILSFLNIHLSAPLSNVCHFSGTLKTKAV